jgi:hypothetical protein
MNKLCEFCGYPSRLQQKMLAFLALFPPPSLEAIDQTYNSNPQSHSSSVTVWNCFFVHCHRTEEYIHWRGLCIQYRGNATSLIQDSAFVFCSVGSQSGDGACYFVVQSLTVLRCCVSDCTRCWGSFSDVDRFQSCNNEYVPTFTDISISNSETTGCGGLFFGTNVAPIICSLNCTNCQGTDKNGRFIFLEPGSVNGGTLRYSTVIGQPVTGTDIATNGDDGH